jgi:NAD(P)-dependent dehydrogenase (short-subunit alcohol dehydrogenase family)
VIPADVSDSAMQEAVDATVHMFGAPQRAVNNVGTGSARFRRSRPAIDMWTHTVQVNLLARFYTLKAELTIAASAGGAVVNVSSVSNVLGPRA